MEFPSSIAKSPLIVALDVDSAERALELASDLAEVAGCLKVGPRLIHRYGADFIQRISQKLPVFVDCKFFDIPSTMVSAVKASFDSGASLVTVHALSGKEALTELAKLESELKKQRPFQILAVTVLTSFTREGLPVVLKDQSLEDHVLALANLVQDSGLSGIVCSPHELSLLRNRGLSLVTPGIRFTLDEKGDQKRVMGPDEAIRAGATAIVVGRPIVEAKSPRDAAMEYAVAMLGR